MTTPAEREIPEELWSSATFEGNRREQLLAWAKMPFAKKIEWVEEAQELAKVFEEARSTARQIVPSETKSTKV